jgi:hypothetical protein
MPDSGGNQEEAPTQSAHPLTYRYEPDTIYRYPATDYNEIDKYPEYTPMVSITLISSFASQKMLFSQATKMENLKIHFTVL